MSGRAPANCGRRVGVEYAGVVGPPIAGEMDDEAIAGALSGDSDREMADGSHEKCSGSFGVVRGVWPRGAERSAVVGTTRPASSSGSFWSLSTFTSTHELSEMQLDSPHDS